MLSDDDINDVLERVYGFRLERWELEEGGGLVMELSRAIESAATEPLLARIAELEAAAFRDSTALNYWKDKCALLEQQLEEARKDAERYRWLREDSIFCNLATPHPWPVWGTSHEDAFPIWKSDLDASIDAARAAIKEQT